MLTTVAEKVAIISHRTFPKHPKSTEPSLMKDAAAERTARRLPLRRSGPPGLSSVSLCLELGKSLFFSDIGFQICQRKILD